MGCSRTGSVATLVVDTTVARAIDKQDGKAWHFILRNEPCEIQFLITSLFLSLWPAPAAVEHPSARTGFQAALRRGTLPAFTFPEGRTSGAFCRHNRRPERKGSSVERKRGRTEIEIRCVQKSACCSERLQHHVLGPVSPEGLVHNTGESFCRSNRTQRLIAFAHLRHVLSAETHFLGTSQRSLFRGRSRSGDAVPALAIRTGVEAANALANPWRINSQPRASSPGPAAAHDGALRGRAGRGQRHAPRSWAKPATPAAHDCRFWAATRRVTCWRTPPSVCG